MFSKFTTIFHQAVEVLAPTQPVQGDFLYHWKAITNYYLERKDERVSIEQTNIQSHLDQMLETLVQEEKSSESGSTGPCMEYMLQHKLLETMYTLGRSDSPPGMKQAVLVFFTKLLSWIRQPLLPHINVYRPVHRLIHVCGEVLAAPTENEEIQFLLTVCAKLKADPYLVNFFIESPKNMKSPKTSQSKDQEKQGEPKVKNPEFSLIKSLLALINSADGRVCVKSCEGLLLCASLPEDYAACCLIEHTDFCRILSSKLCTLYTNIPRALDPADIELAEAKWGLDRVTESDDTQSFPGKRQLISFLSWLDYCDQLIYVAHPKTAIAMSNAIISAFFEGVLLTSILQTCESTAITATAMLTRCLRLVTSKPLSRGLVEFILGSDREPEYPQQEGHKLRHKLIMRCNHLSQEMSLANLKLFETLLVKPNEHTFHNLVLRNLIGRDYCSEEDGEEAQIAGEEIIQSKSRRTICSERHDYNVNGESSSVATSDSVSSWSPSCSVTSSPSNSPKKPAVHKIVNSFLCLLPEDVKSSYQMTDSGYDTYLRDAHVQFADVCSACQAWGWPSSPTAEPEYKREQFFEGAFLKMLFDKLSRILSQSYETNLQVTSIISKLALLPHGNLHEYLLFPDLPLSPGARSLFTIFRKVVNDLEIQIKVIPDLSAKLMTIRQQLVGVLEEQRKAKHNLQVCIENGTMLQGVIIMEEFCKELAAIAFVKHHDIMGK
ncbi:protein FAM160B1-like [Lingula anatina]|uniref:Protein FAM160B1-like n=1 Tax=Lingula anatina TaxID=7574 RepID=A0A2R2MNK5_LINAN|nr:protein FAM160B1-like [Lingula anatina]|eukprot:XP_023931796.1 protein FAM160B1-like [Lingula anatina]